MNIPQTPHSRGAVRQGHPQGDGWYPVMTSQAASARPAKARGRSRARPRRRRWYRRPEFWLGLIFVALLLAVATGGAVAYAVATVPLPDDLDEAPTVVLDRDGEEIGELYAEASREDVELEQIPEHTREAVLAAEDAEFYDHPGVSIPGIVRAAVRNVRSGEVRQGGSTISQQYVKNITGQAELTAWRKIREAVLAMKLEREVPKDQILEYYLNTIYFGRGAYGVQAAARAYFDADVDELTPAQSALLAGFIPAPSASDPVEHPDRAAERYGYVVDQLDAAGWVTPSEASRLRDAQPEVTPRARPRSGPAPFFMAMVEDELARRLGASRAYRGNVVRSTLDLDMQQIAETTYDQRYDELREQLRAEYGEDVDVPTGAVVSLDPTDGSIRALVGGRNFARDSYNLAIGGPDGQGRQPGSTFKPLALAAWIAAGNSPESVFDAPSSIEFAPEESGDPGGWEVENYGGAGYGPMTLREATWRSVNTVYAQVALEVGPQRIAALGEDAGVTSQLDANPSIVLGAEEVSPLDLAAVYNTLASGGIAFEPSTIDAVTRGGEVVYEPQPDRERVLDEDVAWTTVDVLRGVVEQGTGTAAAIGRPAAGKTGTTQNSGDAWFAGFTPNLTTVVWMGYRDSNEPMPGSPTGGGFPAQLWADYMGAALEGVPEEDFPEPTGEYEVTRDAAPEPTTAPEPEPAPAPEATAPAVEPEPEPEPAPTEVVPAPEEPPAPPPEPEEPPEPPIDEPPIDAEEPAGDDAPEPEPDGQEEG